MQASYLIDSIRALEYKANALQKICEFLTHDGDLKTLLEKIVNEVLNLLKSESAIIILKEQDEFIYRFGFSVNVNEAVIQKIEDAFKEKKIDVSLFSELIEKKEPIILDSTSGTPLKELGFIKNIIATPLVVKNEITGILCVMNKKDGFNGEDINLMVSLASPVAMIIENFKLRLKSITDLTEIAILIKAIDIVNSQENLENVLNKLMILARELIDAVGTSILLYSEEKDALYFAAVTGEKKDELKDVLVPRGKGIAGYVFETGESILIEDVRSDERWSSIADEKSGFVTQTLIAVPLKINERVIGVVEGINKKGGARFTKKDLRMLMTFSNSAAIALYKARQYEELERTLWLTMNAISDLVNPFDPSQRGRALRISDVSQKIAKEMDLPLDDINTLKWAAVLNEIGKLLIPPGILEKKEMLTPEEYEAVLKVPKLVGGLFPGIKKFKDAIPVIENIYERYDGTGPGGKKADEIPLLARILSLAVAFDSLTSDKQYRKKLSDKSAIEEIKKFEGLQFDPYVIGVFMEILKKENRI